MSLHSLYEISRRSFTTLQGAMNAVGQNVANANTEGYARRRLDFKPESTDTRGLYTQVRGGVLGAGVSIGRYDRVRDGLVEAAAWHAQGDLGGADESYRILSSMESIFPDGDASLGARIEGFWDAWSDLADAPTEGAAREAVRSQGSALAGLLGRLDTDIQALTDQTTEALTSGVEEVNGKLRELADLNKTIVTSRNAGVPDLAAEDVRDTLVSELAAFGPIRVHEEEAAGYRITMDGMVVVDGDVATELNLDLIGGAPSLTFGDTGVAFGAAADGRGRLGARLHALTDALPDARQRLDDLTAALVQGVNDVHANLTDDAGNPVASPDFFSVAAGPPPTGLTAGTVRLSDAVRADASVIAPHGRFHTDGGGTEREAAYAMAQLRETLLVNGRTVHDEAVDLESSIGGGVQRASARAQGSEAVVEHLSALAAGVSGVSMEDEMTNLIQFQQAYGAAARVLSTAEEMMDTLLRI